jgi:hypothetical protein
MLFLDVRKISLNINGMENNYINKDIHNLYSLPNFVKPLKEEDHPNNISKTRILRFPRIHTTTPLQMYLSDL